MSNNLRAMPSKRKTFNIKEPKYKSFNLEKNQEQLQKSYPESSEIKKKPDEMKTKKKLGKPESKQENVNGQNKRKQTTSNSRGGKRTRRSPSYPRRRSTRILLMPENVKGQNKRKQTASNRRGGKKTRSSPSHPRRRSTRILLMPNSPFLSIVRDIILQTIPNAPFFQISALFALQEAAEFYLIDLFEDANLLAIENQRITVERQDIRLALARRSSVLAA